VENFELSGNIEAGMLLLVCRHGSFGTARSGRLRYTPGYQNEKNQGDNDSQGNFHSGFEPFSMVNFWICIGIDQ
jgi:hypothetical protein